MQEHFEQDVAQCPPQSNLPVSKLFPKQKKEGKGNCPENRYFVEIWLSYSIYDPPSNHKQAYYIKKTKPSIILIIIISCFLVPQD